MSSEVLWQGEVFEGVPVPLLDMYSAALEATSRAVQMRAKFLREGDSVGDALTRNLMFVLQGRIDGIRLTWHALSGYNEDSDDQLMRAIHALDEREAREA